MGIAIVTLGRRGDSRRPGSRLVIAALVRACASILPPPPPLPDHRRALATLRATGIDAAWTEHSEATVSELTPHVLQNDRGGLEEISFPVFSRGNLVAWQLYRVPLLSDCPCTRVAAQPIVRLDLQSWTRILGPGRPRR